MGQAEAKSQKLDSGIPKGMTGAQLVEASLLLPGIAINQESNSRYSGVGSAILAAKLSPHPSVSLFSVSLLFI